MPHMPRIAFIGAGSTVFTRNLVGDVLRLPELADSTTFALMDIDAERLRTSELVTRRLVAAHGAGARVEATLDRREALDGADYVVTSFQVGGYRPSTVIDFEVPEALRAAPDDRRHARRRRHHARAAHDPGAARRLPRHGGALPGRAAAAVRQPDGDAVLGGRGGAAPIRTVGLCHSVQHTAGELAADLGIPVEEVDYHVAGINHMAFFLRLERDGEDLYPALQRVIEEGRVPDDNRVRYEVHAPLRPLRHGVLGALRRVRAVVHQGRPART